MKWHVQWQSVWISFIPACAIKRESRHPGLEDSLAQVGRKECSWHSFFSSVCNLLAGGWALKRLNELVKCFVFIYKTLNHKTDSNKLNKSKWDRKVYEAEQASGVVGGCGHIPAVEMGLSTPKTVPLLEPRTPGAHPMSTHPSATWPPESEPRHPCWNSILLTVLNSWAFTG